MTEERIPVLIVGAGAAGLTLSLLLQQQGIASLLVERRPDVSIYPRARNLNFRSMEIFRSLGLGAEVHSAGTRVSQMVLRETLASKQEKVTDPTTQLQLSDSLSPEPLYWYCPQSRLEPLLRTAARQRGVDARYGATLVSFVQDDIGVTATVEEHPTGRTYLVHADYLAACDGAHSHVRQQLGIPTTGYGALPEYFIFVYFRAPWQQLIAGHEADAFVIKNQTAEGMFLVAKDDMGMFLITDRTSQGESATSFTPERCRILIQNAIGKENIPVEVIDIAHWQSAESVASRFQQGRAFLVGDAAHTMPPYKGLGANTAIQSAQNLSWKLAAVLGGQAAPELLTTYEKERLPVGRLAAHQSLTGPAAAWLPKKIFGEHLEKDEELPFFFPVVGYRYHSQAVYSEDVTAPQQEEVILLDRQDLTGIPGTRVPHVWLQGKSGRISTLDLLDGSFVLLSGGQGGAWCEAATPAGAALGIKLRAHQVGPNADLVDEKQDFEERLGMSSEGAVLLRPDGFVAWRSVRATSAPQKLLEEVLSRLLCRAQDVGA